jgi:hypothetical protein
MVAGILKMIEHPLPPEYTISNISATFSVRTFASEIS